MFRVDVCKQDLEKMTDKGGIPQCKPYLQSSPGFPNPKMFFLVRLFQVSLVLVVKLSGIWAFSGGPPLSTCEYMLPHHEIAGAKPSASYKAQTGEPPYNINVSKHSYTAGENLTVTILGTSTFKGFILQARGSDSPVAWPVGEFVQMPPSGTYSSLFHFQRA